MSGPGPAQTAMEHPELRAQNLLLIRTAVKRLLHSDVRADGMTFLHLVSPTIPCFIDLL